jgi:crotonobetainyl-CoA:carnitine CoA-transferase CaiB-like acyl-CoA transferase
LRLSGFEFGEPSAAPAAGSDSLAILTQLGLTELEIADLRANAVI